MGQKLIVVLQVVATSTKRKEILRAIRPLLAPTRVLKGCIRINLLQDIESPNVLTLVEEWKSQGDLDYHLCSDEFKMILQVMEMSRKRPEIRFHTIAGTSGLEVVQAVRGGQGQSPALTGMPFPEKRLSPH